jgi:hypothetical protein
MRGGSDDRRATLAECKKVYAPDRRRGRRNHREKQDALQPVIVALRVPGRPPQHVSEGSNDRDRS